LTSDELVEMVVFGLISSPRSEPIEELLEAERTKAKEKQKNTIASHIWLFVVLHILKNNSFYLSRSYPYFLIYNIFSGQ
jgi:hypothetical protein